MCERSKPKFFWNCCTQKCHIKIKNSVGRLNPLTPPPLNTALKVGAKSNLRTKRAEKIGLFYAESLHSVLCVSRKSATKNIPPSFQFFTFPKFFQEAFASTCQWSGRP